MVFYQGLVAAAVALESLGKMLFGALLGGVGLAGFLLISFGLTAAVFLAWAGYRLPRGGRAPLLRLNIATAVSFGCFFFALKHAAPAVVASLDVGASIVTALVLARIADRSSLCTQRVIACFGIVAGTLLLCAVEIDMAPAGTGKATLLVALVAGAVTGVTSTFSATSSKALSVAGWTPAQILAHRFHLTLVLAIAWIGVGEPGLALPPASALPAIALVAAVAVILPLFLLQLALRNCDTLSVMVCCAVQPLLSFLVTIPSPAHGWNMMTLFGVAIVTAFLMVDVAVQRGAMPRFRARRAAA
jgi:hypothetical protein